MAESFAALLKRHRVAAGLSQETLAERAGVSVDAISYLERDERHAPQKATLNLLIAALALDDDSRHQIEEAAKYARARGPQTQFLPKNNLPPQLTSFVDRESAVAEIKERLQSYRLVTVVGTGGAGKTRCAIQVGLSVLENCGDGVWLAELAPISDAARVTPAIAGSLRLRETPSRPILDTLLAYLKRKHLLLIVDNCEHVLDEARRVVATILHGCRGVRILATSRQSLTIAGEQVYRMPSLPVPSASELLFADKVSQYGAVQLFTDRAVSANNGFTLSVESAPHVADICRRLDGIPLAIELAAARVKVLSPRELAQRLDERFRVLTGGDRSALPRHQTMRALIDWSYDLLSDDERALFRKLSIFAGGFTLEAAAAVCGDGEIDEILVLDLVSSLVNKSLVQAEPNDGEMRFRLLDSTRQYAREKLIHAGEEAAAAHAHARAFLRLAERLDRDWEAEPDNVWFARAESEFDNFRAALSWSFGAGDALVAQRMVGALRPVWVFHAPVEGRRWLHASHQVVAANTPTEVLAALDLAEADLSWYLSHFETSARLGERALTRYRKLADARGIAKAELRIGRAKVILGEIVEGEATLTRVLEALRAQGAFKTAITALMTLAFARNGVGDLPGARQRYSETLAASRALGSDRLTATTLVSWGEAEFRHGNSDEALRLADEARPIFLALGHTHIGAIAASNMATYLVALRRHDEARTAAREALAGLRDAQEPALFSIALQHFAAIAGLRPPSDLTVIEERRRAARILGYADARLAVLEASRTYTEQQEYDATLSALREALGADQLARLMTEAATWCEDQAVAEAMLI